MPVINRGPFELWEMPRILMKIQELEAVTSWQSSQYPAGRKIKKLGGAQVAPAKGFWW